MRQNADVSKVAEKKDIKGLIKLFDKKYTDDVRLEALRTLKKMPDKRAIKPLMKLLSDLPPGYSPFTFAIRDILVAIGSDAVKPMIKALDDPALRNAALSVLGKIGDPVAFDPILKLLPQTEGLDQQSVIDALGGIGGPQVVQTLLTIVKRGKPEDSASESIRILGALGDSTAASALLEAANDVRFRKDALVSLAKLGDPRALQPLLGELGGDKMYLAAAEALGRLGDARAIPALFLALTSDRKYLPGYAAAALGRIGDRQVVPKLLELLIPKKYDLRAGAAEGLGLLGDPRAVPALVEVMLDNEYLVVEIEHNQRHFARIAAAEALGRIGDPTALRALDELAREREYRITALKAMAEFGTSARGMILPHLNDNSKEVRIQAEELLENLKDVKPAAMPTDLGSP